MALRPLQRAWLRRPAIVWSMLANTVLLAVVLFALIVDSAPVTRL